ncbi:MAG: family 1 glycosylhydrolase [Vulcanimicrobiaceae bacterium]
MIELWASPEPTIARISENDWRDQLAETGHDARLDDVDLIAGLGVQATRYPVLWERNDFAWARPRLERLRERGVEPIVTLLHHGSGPAYTSLVDPEFPQRFAEYAAAAACEFPWVRRWTPINEPLTTARFATLYGHWYPNLRDDRAFGTAITNEARAIQLAFGRIRARIPDAELTITEDLQGFTAANSAAEADAQFYRERSFLSLELVMGRVKPGHALWRYLTETAGVSPSMLRDIAEYAVEPHTIGWNWYPYSERVLCRRDGELVDAGAVTLQGYEVSPRPLLRDAYRRLGRPQAIAEVHLHAPEDARAAWLLARYDDALSLQAEGVPMTAVGAWAAFGMVDWDSLLLERRDIVEDGIFTFARAGETPQETAVSHTLRDLALCPR